MARPRDGGGAVSDLTNPTYESAPDAPAADFDEAMARLANAVTAMRRGDDGPGAALLTNVQDIRTVHRSGDLAVTVGFERGPAQVDGGPLADMVIRVTHVLRGEANGWRLVHRHADFPPPDARVAS
jgi:SnoaL-like domain